MMDVPREVSLIQLEGRTIGVRVEATYVEAHFDAVLELAREVIGAIDLSIRAENEEGTVLFSLRHLTALSEEDDPCTHETLLSPTD